MLPLIFLFCVAQATNTCTLSRLIEVTRIVPFSPNTAEAFIDVGHARASATGIYPSGILATLDSDSKDFMFYMTGLNFSNAVSQAGGLYLPEAALYPYSLGLDAGFPTNRNFTRRVTYDSDNKKRGKDCEWIFVAVGNVMIMLQNGTYPGGVLAGKSYQGGPLFGPNVYKFQDGFGMAQYNLLDADSDWTKPKNRELFEITTPWVVKQVPDSNNNPLSISRLSIEDQYESHGYGVLAGTYGDFNDSQEKSISTLTMMWQ